jgi:molybdopterin synthase catalytic subunit
VIRSGLTREPIDEGAILRELPSPKDGAVLLFLGVVRDENRGRRVTGITYEAYEEMAVGIAEELVSQAEERFGTGRIRLVHRVGELHVGEVSTAVAVATPHREEAYQASRFLIEGLKDRLPVWKEEHYEEGDSTWLGAGGKGREG